MAMANNVEPEVLVNCMLGKIYDKLLNGDGKVVPKSEDHYLAFMSPGIPLLEDDFLYAVEGFGGVSRRRVDQQDLPASIGPAADGGAAPPADSSALPEDALMKYARAEAFHAMCDLIPDTSGIIDSGRINVWRPEARVSSVYATALQQSQVIDVQPDEETKAKIEKWRAKLQSEEVTKNIVTDEDEVVVRESRLVKAYNEKMLAYLAAATEYNEARISALSGKDHAAVHRFATNGSLLQRRVSAAMSDWSSNGFKGEYEALTSAIQSVEERSYTLLKQRFKEDYLRSVLTNPSSGANFLYSAPAPASFTRSESGWSTFEFNSGSFESRHAFSAKASRGAGGFTLGAFSVGGGGSVTNSRWEGKIDTTKFRMSCSMCRVPIYRPWFHLDFIKSGCWRFAPDNVELANSMISDGGQPANGLMPAITTECVFVKNLVVDFGRGQTAFSRFQRSVAGKGGAAIGPFWAGGSHANRSDQRQHSAEWMEEGVRIPGLQLAGFICHVLQKAPNPNPGITRWI
jgi:hypothetical protein